MTSMTGGCLCGRVGYIIVGSAGRDPFSLDRAAIWADVAQRNALRKSAQLPLLDEQKEFDNACQTILSARWQAFRPTKQADYDRIREEVVAERGHPSGSIGGWGIRMKIGKRFEAFLWAHCRDELTIAMQIAPDYLAITRQVTEGRETATDTSEMRSTWNVSSLACPGACRMTLPVQARPSPGRRSSLARTR